MVVIAAAIARDANDLTPIEMSARVGRRAHPVPLGPAIAADVSAFDSLLEKHERATKYGAEPSRLDRVELLLGIVEIVDVERPHAEVRRARLDLVCDERRRQRVAAANDVFRRYNAWIDEHPLEVLEIVIACLRRSAIERDIAAL